MVPQGYLSKNPSQKKYGKSIIFSSFCTILSYRFVHSNKKHAFFRFFLALFHSHLTQLFPKEYNIINGIIASGPLSGERKRL